jgi:hypothetical protein
MIQVGKRLPVLKMVKQQVFNTIAKAFDKNDKAAYRSISSSTQSADIVFIGYVSNTSDQNFAYTLSPGQTIEIPVGNEVYIWTSSPGNILCSAVEFEWDV